MLYFFGNILIYLIALLFFIKRDKKLTLRIVVLFLYGLFAYASYHTLDVGIYQQTFGAFPNVKMSVMPFLLNFAVVMILVSSITGYDKYLNPSEIEPIINSKVIKLLEFVIIVLSLIYVTFEYQWYQLFASVDLSDIYDAAHEGEATFVFPESWMNILYYRSKQVIEFLLPIIYLVEFCHLVLPYDAHRKKALLTIGLIFIPQLIGCGIAANRGGMVFTTSYVIFFIIVFWPKMEKKMRKGFVLSGVGVGVILVSYLLAISESRFGQNDADNTSVQIWRYFGEAYPNLAYRIWMQPGNFLYGAREFTDIYKFFGGYVPDLQSMGMGVGGGHDYWGSVSGFPILNFKTIYGDMYCEFGPVIPFFIIFAYLGLIWFLQKRLNRSIFVLVTYFFTYRVLVWGLFNNTITEDFLINMVSTIIVVYILMRLVSNQKTERYELTNN